MINDYIFPFFIGILIGILISLMGAVCVAEGEDPEFNKQLCKQLYSNTDKYLECTTKSRFEIIKVIKGID